MEVCINTLKELCSSEFNCGYLAALLLVLTVFLLLMVLRFILWLLFRTKRCSEVVIPQEDGLLVISKDAVFGAIRRELADYPQLPVRQLQLRRRGKQYSISLFCDYCPGDESGLPELTTRLKQQIRDMLSRSLGFSNLKSLTLKIEEMETASSSGSAIVLKPAAPAVETGIFTPSDEK